MFFRIPPTHLLVSAALTALLAMPCTGGANDQLDKFYGLDFELRDHNGEHFRLLDMRGKVVLIEFGFTSCADICPVSLAKLAMAMRELGPLVERVQPLFISVDTKRDTPAVLREYTTYFHPAILGLTGSQSEVEAVARKFRTRVRVRPADDSGFYVVDHGSKLFFVGPDGRLANALPTYSSPETITLEIRKLLD